jgi:hypothetical protein
MYVVLVSRRRLRPQSPSESDIALEKPMSAGSDDYSLMRSAVYTTLTNPSILKQLGFAAYQEFVPKLVQTVHNNLQEDTDKVDEQMMKHQQEQLTPRGSGHTVSQNHIWNFGKTGASCTVCTSWPVECAASAYRVPAAYRGTQPQIHVCPCAPQFPNSCAAPACSLSLFRHVSTSTAARAGGCGGVAIRHRGSTGD